MTTALETDTALPATLQGLQNELLNCNRFCENLWNRCKSHARQHRDACIHHYRAETDVERHRYRQRRRSHNLDFEHDVGWLKYYRERRQDVIRAIKIERAKVREHNKLMREVL